MAREHRYAAVLLDLMLPGLSGYQVCARLRAEGNDVPVLMLTAKNGEYDEAEGLDTGADDYLAKPFSYVVLEARLRALVRRGGARLSTVLQAGDLWLDPARRACGRGTDRITLTPKEFAVLHCLLSRPDEVVPRSTSSTRSGPPTSPATRTSSTSTSAPSARRSTFPSAGTPSRPYEEPATG
ncbi:hypothetical protein Shyd_70480 [Streptomyces hydrogenans]|uniref:Uncharacterized protein n=1 Tax=Streptomyces hydrogenans TaxID=1873719 RepID=A0ABQ3PKY6_9ACTN|nr:hypothetical protein Shyd_70480 [Streptomyces hydrogenans]